MKFQVPSILIHFPYYCSNAVRQSYDNNEMSERVIVCNHLSICTERAVSPFGLCKVLCLWQKELFMCNVMQQWRLCSGMILWIVNVKSDYHWIWWEGDGREAGRCWGNDFSSDVLQGHGSTLFLLLLSKSASDIWDFMGCTIYAASSEAPSAEGPEAQRRPHGHGTRTCRTRDRWGSDE